MDATTINHHNQATSTASNSFYPHSPSSASSSNKMRKTDITIDQDIQEEIELDDHDQHQQHSDEIMATAAMNAQPSEETLLINSLLQIENNFVDRLNKDLDQHDLMKQLYNTNTNSNPRQQHTIDLKSLINTDMPLVKQMIVDSVNCECQSIIKWAALLPEFNMLCIEDQTNSIELNFLEVLIINFIWRSVHSLATAEATSAYTSELKLVFNKYLAFSQTDCNQLDLAGVFDHLTSIVVKLRKMAITQEEYLSLKALALFKSDYGFMNVDKFEAFRDKCFRTLRQASSARTSSPTAAAHPHGQSQHRYESYLLLLADIKSISMRFMHYIIMFQNDYNIQMPTLLNDMFITQNMFGMTAHNFSSFTGNNNSNNSNINSNSGPIDDPGMQMAMKQKVSTSSETGSDCIGMRQLKTEPSSASSASSMDDNTSQDEYSSHHHHHHHQQQQQQC